MTNEPAPTAARRVGISKKRLAQGRDAERRQALFSSPSFQAGISTTGSGRTQDSFQNFQLNLGIGTDNALSGSTYGFNPITRNRILLEWMHRGSWLAGVAIDCVADDMTKSGIEITAGLDPDDIRSVHTAATNLAIWPSINDAIKWARLYGGSIGVIDIDGQDVATPLDASRVGKGQFLGVYALDRWMVEPSLNDIVPSGPGAGTPRFYRPNSMSPFFRFKKIHYSRCIRLEGVRLPWQQRQMENMWGISVLERLNDRIIAFDSATMGAAQLVYKSYLRTLKIKDLRKITAGPPQAVAALAGYVDTMRRYQGIEGVTLIDAEDEFQAVTSTGFTGIGDALAQFGQQLAGALQIPLVRLFGMSPAGFSATGESDLRTYHDNIKQRQQRDLRVGIEKIYLVLIRSEGIKLGDDFDFEFRSLYELNEVQKAEVTERGTAAVIAAHDAGIIGNKTALSELRQIGRSTGYFTHITDEMIEDAEEEPPAPAPEPAETEEGGEEGEAGSGAEGGTAAAPEKQDTLSTLRKLPAPRDSLVPGVSVIVENPKGTTRYPHRTQLPADYGHIRGTSGADGEQVDCFVGPEPEAGHDAWVIDQVDPESGEFDEHKVMLGFPTRTLALRAYQRSFDDGSGAARIGHVSRVPITGLSDWLTHKAKDQTKLAKSAVGFEHPAKGPHHCSECAHFQVPHSCEIVAGTIDRSDWCKRFDEAKRAAA